MQKHIHVARGAVQHRRDRFAAQFIEIREPNDFAIRRGEFCQADLDDTRFFRARRLIVRIGIAREQCVVERRVIA